MDMTLRWFGEGIDSVSLEQIRQIPGVKGVITTLYDIPFLFSTFLICAIEFSPF